MIKVDYSNVYLNGSIDDYQADVSRLHHDLFNLRGKGNDYVGWLNLPNSYDKEEFAYIQELADEIQDKADVLLVCGIGGSYLGTRAVVEMVQGLRPNNKVELIYVGNTFSSTYINQVLKYIDGKSVYLNVISKSGTTLETALSFRIFKEYIEKKYGEESTKRIIATTDKENGLLRKTTVKYGYRSLVIPADVGGRFSVNTAVGLLPLAAAGINIQEFMNGFKKGYDDFSSERIEENAAYKYAVTRRILNKEKGVELFVTYDSHLTSFAEWWKQLIGESEGKENKGLYPASVNFSTDLHSMGQFVQEGTKLLFETLLNVENPLEDIKIPFFEDDFDNLNYLADRTLNDVNHVAAQGTLIAHYETGKVSNIIITIPDTKEETVGYLMYFFFMVIAMSGYLLDINPFDQPGVEVYKKNMFSLLKK